jgi:hypothetical protein
MGHVCTCPVKIKQQKVTYSFCYGRCGNCSAVPILKEGALNTRFLLFRGSILPAKVTLWSINLLGKYMRVDSESNDLLVTNLCNVNTTDNLYL